MSLAKTDTGGVARRRCRHRRCRAAWAGHQSLRARASARQLPGRRRCERYRIPPRSAGSAASRPIRGHTHGSTRGSTRIPPEALSAARPVAASVAQGGSIGASPPAPPVAPSRRRSMGRRGPFVVVRDPKERELRVARRRARANLPSPAAVTRDIALALLEVEAGCRSAAQLERVVSPSCGRPWNGASAGEADRFRAADRSCRSIARRTHRVWRTPWRWCARATLCVRLPSAWTPVAAGGS